MTNNFTMRVAKIVMMLCCAQVTVSASSGRQLTNPPMASSLEQLSSSLVAISRQVEPAVVQIFNSAYQIEAEGDHVNAAVVAQERSSGSGVLITSDGFVVTNAHVVERTRHLWVRLNKQVTNVRTHLVDAKLIGVDRQLIWR